MTNDETNPESSPSLAGAMHQITSAPDKELDDRALAAACGLMLEFHIGRFDCFRDGEFQSATGKEIAAILRPFLQSKPKPTP